MPKLTKIFFQNFNKINNFVPKNLKFSGYFQRFKTYSLKNIFISDFFLTFQIFYVIIKNFYEWCINVYIVASFFAIHKS